MRKEALIAISAGFVFGLLITFGIYTANKALKQKSKTTADLPTPEASLPAPSPSPQSSLEILEPENNLVTAKSKVTLSGKTEPNISVAILGEEYENIVITDKDGLFSDEVPLISGANEIRAMLENRENSEQEKIINIVYTTAKI